MNVKMHSQAGTRSEQAAPAPAPAPAPAAAATMVAAKVYTERDARGRIIEARRLNGLELYRLMAAMGPDASNAALMDYASIYVSVRAIDGDSVDFPVTKLQIEALMQRLDVEGFAASAAALSAAAKDSGDVKELAKN